MTKTKTSNSKEQRLAAKLRENLRKRKAQAKRRLSVPNQELTQNPAEGD